MRLPFDGKKAIDSIVSVKHASTNWGRGFIVLESYIVTAAHCLPLRSVEGLWHGDHWPVHVRSLREKRNRVALVRNYDPCADIAVLANTTSSGGYLDVPKWEELYQDLVENRGLPVRLEPPPEGSRVYLFTVENKWICGTSLGGAFCTFDGKVPGGTSGSPVFDAHGRVFGVVSTAGSEVKVAVLGNDLPGWLLEELADAR